MKKTKKMVSAVLVAGFTLLPATGLAAVNDGEQDYGQASNYLSSEEAVFSGDEKTIMTSYGELPDFLARYESPKVEEDQNAHIYEQSAYQYLLNKGVPVDQLNRLSEDVLASAMGQSEAYSLTDEQIKQYIEGRIADIDSPTIYSSSGEAIFSDDGKTIITSYGELPNLLTRYTSPEALDGLEGGATFSFSGSSGDNTDFYDQSGVYYAAKSNSDTPNGFRL